VTELGLLEENMIKNNIMKSIKGTGLLLVAILNFVFVGAQTQNLPDDPALRDQAQERYVLLTDLEKSADFKGASPHLFWLLSKTPKFNKNIYIKGSRIYESLADAEKDAVKKAALQDSALMIYELRIQNFGEEATVMNRKGLKAYIYLKDRPGKKQELLDLYKKILTLNGENTMPENGLYYMDLLSEQKKLGKVTEDEFIAVYDKITAAVDKALNDPKNVAQKDHYGRVKSSVEKIFIDNVDMHCDRTKEKFGPKFKANPDDINQNKKILQFLLAGSCTEDPMFLDVAVKIFEKEPTVGLGLTIGKLYKGTGQMEKANEFFNKAIELTEDATKKGDIYKLIGDIHYSDNKYSTARTHYQKAISLGAGDSKEAYERIGDMYMQSYNTCKTGKAVADRVVFIAAYEMYEKAGSSSKMAKAKEQFPSAEDIFGEDMTVGQQVKVGCWINETVTLKKR
jgi:tetratricopeptide (TPR) repeat protein